MHKNEIVKAKKKEMNEIIMAIELKKKRASLLLKWLFVAQIKQLLYKNYSVLREKVLRKRKLINVILRISAKFKFKMRRRGKNIADRRRQDIRYSLSFLANEMN